jgi:hypothetical protein
MRRKLVNINSCVEPLREHVDGYLHVSDIQSLMHMRQWQGTSGSAGSPVAWICICSITVYLSTGSGSHCVEVHVERGLEAFEACAMRFAQVGRHHV